MNPQFVTAKSVQHLIDRVLAKIESTDYGVLITYGDLERLLEVRRDNPKLGQIVRRAARIALEKCNKHVKCLKNEGYEVRVPSKQLRDAVSFAAQGVRRFKKCNAVAACIDKEQLTAPERSAAEFISRRSYDLLTAVKAERKALLAAIPTETKSLPWTDGSVASKQTAMKWRYVPPSQAPFRSA